MLSEFVVHCSALR